MSTELVLQTLDLDAKEPNIRNWYDVKWSTATAYPEFYLFANMVWMTLLRHGGPEIPLTVLVEAVRHRCPCLKTDILVNRILHARQRVHGELLRENLRREKDGEVALNLSESAALTALDVSNVVWNTPETCADQKSPLLRADQRRVDEDALRQKRNRDEIESVRSDTVSGPVDNPGPAVASIRSELCDSDCLANWERNMMFPDGIPPEMSDRRAAGAKTRSTNGYDFPRTPSPVHGAQNASPVPSAPLPPLYIPGIRELFDSTSTQDLPIATEDSTEDQSIARRDATLSSSEEIEGSYDRLFDHHFREGQRRWAEKSRMWEERSNQTEADSWKSRADLSSRESSSSSGGSSGDFSSSSSSSSSGDIPQFPSMATRVAVASPRLPVFKTKPDRRSRNRPSQRIKEEQVKEESSDVKIEFSNEEDDS